MIDSLSNRFQYNDNKLIYEFSKAHEQKLAKAVDLISASLTEKIQNIENAIIHTEKKDSDSDELNLHLNELRSQITVYTKLKNKLTSIAAAAILLREKEQLLIPKINPSIPKSDSQNG